MPPSPMGSTPTPAILPAIAANFSRLPAGVQRLAGVDFDLRGIIQLKGATMDRLAMTHSYPRAREGISVKQRARKLHLLHGLGWGLSDPAGTVVGKYVVHFANGEHREIPFTLGADAWEWSFSSSRKQHPYAAQSKLAWRGKSGVDANAELLLYTKSWDNPLPAVEIDSIDFVSAMTEASPFLLAITAE